MRQLAVNIAGKVITVKELRVGELRQLVEKVGGDFLAADFGKDQSEGINKAVAFIGGHITEIFPELVAEDIDKAYPSEIEALVEAFINVNFFGVRKVWGGVLDFAERMARLNGKAK